MLAAMPTQMVDTSHLTYCMVSARKPRKKKTEETEEPKDAE